MPGVILPRHPPCIFPIYGGVKPGLLFHISGRAMDNAHKFTVSLQQGSSPIPSPEIALHINIGFYNFSIVRNSRHNGVWGLEENFIANFPFQPGVNFSISISVQNDRYNIVINGQHTISFMHRLASVSHIDTLYIDDDAVICSVRCVGL